MTIAFFSPSLDPRVIRLLPVPALLSCARSAQLRPSSLIEAPDIDQVDSEETPCGGDQHAPPAHFPTDSSAQPATGGIAVAQPTPDRASADDEGHAARRSSSKAHIPRVCFANGALSMRHHTRGDRTCSANENRSLESPPNQRPNARSATHLE